MRGIARLLLIALRLVALRAPAGPQATTLDDMVAAVVRIKTFINPDGNSVSNLGREREGSGIVIDENGLVLTIGYLMVEAHAAELITNAGRTVPANIVGYDHETGFGLLRAIEPLKIKPLPFGKSADVKEQDPELVASFGGADMVAPVHVVAAASSPAPGNTWSTSAIFTSPPHPAWSGAALINREGKLVGVGSLIVGDAGGSSDRPPGNMFVPIDLLLPIMADLFANGRISRAPGRPWLGVNAEELRGQPGRRPGHAGQPGREGRAPPRRRHRRHRRRAPQHARRFLSQAVGAAAPPALPCRSTCCQRRAPPHRRPVDQSARHLKLKSTF